MAEFKVSSGIDGDISAFQTAGSELNASFAATDSAGVSTLSTAMACIAEQQQIKNLIELYMSLVAKDARDLNDMAATARAMDSAVAGSHSG